MKQTLKQLGITFIGGHAKVGQIRKKGLLKATFEADQDG
jgi:hypothetical protein